MCSPPCNATVCSRCDTALTVSFTRGISRERLAEPVDRDISGWRLARLNKGGDLRCIGEPGEGAREPRRDVERVEMRGKRRKKKEFLV